MSVSKNNGTPKSSILITLSIIFTIHFGGFHPIFGNIHFWNKHQEKSPLEVEHRDAGRGSSHFSAVLPSEDLRKPPAAMKRKPCGKVEGFRGSKEWGTGLQQHIGIEILYVFQYCMIIEVKLDKENPTILFWTILLQMVWSQLVVLQPLYSLWHLPIPNASELLRSNLLVHNVSLKCVSQRCSRLQHGLFSLTRINKSYFLTHFGESPIFWNMPILSFSLVI